MIGPNLFNKNNKSRCCDPRFANASNNHLQYKCNAMQYHLSVDDQASTFTNACSHEEKYEEQNYRCRKNFLLISLIRKETSMLWKYVVR